MDDRLPLTYVVGSSHSGSTLLALLADEHPQVASVGETAIKRRIRAEGRAGEQHCSCGTTVAACPFWSEIFADVSARGIPFDVDHWRVDYRFESGWMDRALTRETSSWSRRHVARWMGRNLPGLRRRMTDVDAANVAFVEAVLTRTRRRVFFDGTKLLTRLLYLLDVPAFRINIVHLVRDVRGVAASAKKRGADVAGATQVWLNDQIAIARLRAEYPATEYVCIRYEDLCGSPNDVLSKVWLLCGVDVRPVPTVIETDRHHVLGNSMRMRTTIEVRLDDTWRERLAPDEERRILDVAGTMNAQLGYAR